MQLYESRELTLLEKVVYIVGAIMAALIIGIVVAYWWTTRVPSRPDGVRADAVFLWAPAVGVPAPRRGDWLGCWEEGQQILCQLNNIDGRLEYKGEFVLYSAKVPIPPSTLKIDSIKTRWDAVWVGGALVPLVYLQSGDILVPAVKYDEGVRLLQRRNR
jgi:hypothetical protein